MDKNIEEQLAQIGRSQGGIRILYACESGSRAWGFSSPDSDYDVRFIYARPMSWYLKINPGRDVIELPIAGDLDINGWDLRKALQLMLKGNQSIFEWLNSPIVYRRNPVFHQGMLDLSRHAYRRRAALGHYFGIASRMAAEHLHKEEVPIKKVLYAFRAMLAGQWVLESTVPAPVAMNQLMDGIGLPDEICKEIMNILDAKRSAMEDETIRLSTRLHGFIDQSLADLLRRVHEWELPEPPQDTTLADNLFFRWITEQ